LGLLLGTLGGAAAGTHSLRYFHTAMTDPGPGMPWFVVVGYVDDEKFVHYDNESRRMEPRTEWMAASMDQHMDQQYWEEQTQMAQGNEAVDRGNLDTVPKRYNESGGEHGRSCSSVGVGWGLHGAGTS
ncbi:HA1F protein, partial [Penelope pileata]|nr:HA1F protein [Penelope pileata]